MNKFPDGWIPVPCEGGFLSAAGKPTKIRGLLVPAAVEGEEKAPASDVRPTPDMVGRIVADTEEATGTWLVAGDFVFDERVGAYVAPVSMHAKQPTHRVEVLNEPGGAVIFNVYVAKIGDVAFSRKGFETQSPSLRVVDGNLTPIDPIEAPYRIVAA